MTDKCSICLDDMVSGLGVAVPCGHCFHRDCFACLKTHFSRCSDESRAVPQCPVCKRKVKKFHKVYLNLPRITKEESSLEKEKVEKSIVNVRKENLRLHKRLRDLKTLSNDQSDLLFRILPRYDQLETRYSHMKRERRDLQKRLDALDDENWELLFDNLEAKTSLSRAEEGARNLEMRLEEADGENHDLHVIWDNLEDRLDKSISQKKRAKNKLKQRLRKRTAQLDNFSEEMKKLKAEKKCLEAEMAQSRDEVARLRKKLKSAPRKAKARRMPLTVRAAGNTTHCTK